MSRRGLVHDYLAYSHASPRSTPSKCPAGAWVPQRHLSSCILVEPCIRIESADLGNYYGPLAKCVRSDDSEFRGRNRSFVQAGIESGLLAN